MIKTIRFKYVQICLNIVAKLTLQLLFESPGFRRILNYNYIYFDTLNMHFTAKTALKIQDTLLSLSKHNEIR